MKSINPNQIFAVQEISAYVSENKISTTASGELSDEYADDSTHVVVLSNLAVKAAKIAYWYRNSGENFLENMPPETAFILFDKLTNRTFFGTDAFAVKPLFYSTTSQQLLVHSNLNDLLFFSGATRLNLAKITDYFKWDSDDLPADNQTFYAGIFKLLPGQTGIFANGELTFKSTSLISATTNALPAEEVAQAFKVNFERAISQRNCNVVSAANLSGGLDSSSVAAVLATQLNQRLFTIYYDAQTTAATERAYAALVVNKYQTAHQEVTAPNALFNSLLLVTQQIAQPDPGVLPSFIHTAILAEAKKNQAKRLFSGHGGDNVIGYGFEYLDNLFEERAWRKLKYAGKNYDNLRQRDEPIAAQIFKQKIRRAIEQKKWWLVCKFACICFFYFGIIPLPQGRTVGTRVKSKRTAYETFEQRILKIREAEVVPNVQHFGGDNVPETFTKDQLNHLKASFTRLAVHGNELLSTLGHYQDIGVSFPFFDRELLSVAVQASAEQKFDKGYLRGTLRNALAAYLPAELTTRVSKADFNTAALHYFNELYADFRITFPLNHHLWKIVDARVFQQLVEIIQGDTYTPQQKVKYTWLGMRVINFGVFLVLNE